MKPMNKHLRILKAAVIVLTVIFVIMTIRTVNLTLSVTDHTPSSYRYAFEYGEYGRALSIYYDTFYNVRKVPKRHAEFAAFCSYTEDAFFYKAFREAGMEGQAAIRSERMQEILPKIHTYEAQAKDVTSRLRLTE